jgi:hypothetical protein
MTTEPRRGRPARFPDPASAEAWAITKGTPARGRTDRPINESTRGPVRFWLTAHGIPSAFARSLTVGELSAAWHDTTGATVATLHARAAATPTTTTTTEPEPMTFQPSLGVPATTRRAPSITTEHSADATDKARALADALAAFATHQAAPIDANAVRAIVQDEAGQAIHNATGATLDAVQAKIAAALETIKTAPRALTITVGERTTTLPAAPRHPLFDTLLTLAAVANEPGALCPMLVGPAGSGKTTACKDAATAIGRAFYMTGAVTGAHEFLGYNDAAGKYHGTAFRQAFERGGLFLMDEADRSDPSAMLVLNSALANRIMAFPDRAEPIAAHPDFLAIVAANTYGRGADRLYVGANQMDAATNDRFAMLAWDYDEALERSLAGDDAWTAYIQAARRAAMDAKMRVVISPRASMGGALYRRAGVDFEAVCDLVLWKGLDADQRRKIEGAIPSNIATAARRPVARPVTLAAE